ncbi:MAG: TspO/MBR family protein [Erythrobacter sp.]
MEWTPALIAAGWALLLGGSGGAFTEIGPWYRALKKPRWQPPDWLFGPAWAINLIGAGASFYLGLTQAPGAAARGVIGALFAVTFLLHFLWSPLFFKLQRPDWALAENVLLWLSVAALLTGVPRLSGAALTGLLLVPYFAWVSFAIILNWKIAKLNGPFGRHATRD